MLESKRDLQSGDGEPTKSTLTLSVGVMRVVFPLAPGTEDGESAAGLLSELPPCLEPEPCLPFLVPFFPDVGERRSLPKPGPLWVLLLSGSVRGDGVVGVLFGIPR